MCGIIGLVNPHSNISLEPSLNLLQHRGPDMQGQWQDPHGSCLLGHTRLSILDLDPRAGQPMHSNDGRYTIVFNGEIYNYLELRQGVLAGVPHRTGSDTETLLRLWERMGADCIGLLRGMFAFAVWDSVEHCLWLVRDRLGKKPLYFAPLPQGGLAFASEIPAVLPLLPRTPPLNPAAIDLFLAYQFIPAPHTVYQNIYKALPAHVYRFRPGDAQPEAQRYWTLHFEEDPSFTEERALEALEAGIRESVHIRLRSDVPLGVLLSGGVDSSLITALSCQELGDGVPTFAVGYRESGELPFAEKVAHCWNTEHHPLVLSEKQALGYFDTMLSAYGEPYGDNSALPSLFVCEQARRKIKVALNGDGGDELLAGYGTYKLKPLRRLLGRWSKEAYLLGDHFERAMQKIPCHALEYATERVTSALSPCAKVFRLGQYITSSYCRSMYMPDFYQATRLSRSDYERGLLEMPDLPRNTLNMLLDLDYNHFLAHDLLVKMDIASMHASLETRSPLLDHTLFELCARFPTALKIKDNECKYLLKKLTARFVPPELVYRRKKGFSIPVDSWLRGAFASRMNAFFQQSQHPLWLLLNRKGTEQLWKEQSTGKKKHGQRLWLILCLGAWLETHPDARPEWGA